MQHVRGRAGFTLIEIMVVVFIIGLLATLAGQNVVGYMETARRTKAGADIQAFGQALEMYQFDTAAYPSTGEGLVALVQPPPSASNARPQGYLKKVDKDPWGTPYAYQSDRVDYSIRSYARDRREGGEGWDADIRSEDL